jgi:RES domain-containing protein
VEVFRITLTRYAASLFTSGIAGRWNRAGEKVIYTASSRSLACLENLVHRRGGGKKENYRTMVISVPDDLPIHRVELKDLPDQWQHESEHELCQQIGSGWYSSRDAPILSVPSAVILNERNLVLHTEHPDFSKIKIIREEPFYFDPRL